MIKYYLPIIIGERRMHICHLSDGAKPTAIFEFIVPISGIDGELFKVDSNAKFISVSGDEFKSDKEGITIGLDEDNDDPDELSLIITFGKIEKGQSKSYSGHNISIERDDKERSLTAVVSNQLTIKHLKIKIVYCEENGTKFDCDFVIHLPDANGGNTSIFDAAIDFGSEASQIGFVDYAFQGFVQNVHIVKELKEFHDQYKGLTPEQNAFWQGDSSDTNKETCYFYKSVFFLNKDHDGYAYADRPNKYADKTFLKTLLAEEIAFNAAGQNIYSSLFLLPNLKLIELLGNNQPGGTVDSIPFSVSQKNPHGFRSSQEVLSPRLIEDYVRLILNGMLHTILGKLNNQTDNDIYVNIVLLVPNVYPQEKIYKLIGYFYEDFKTIIKEESRHGYEKFKGVEIKVLSESDASFLGLRIENELNNDLQIENRELAHYLVIDAGKGTTDFSIIRQQESNSSYESVFRAGLPGSGQFLTHAFIDALNDYLPDGTDVYDLVIREKVYAEIMKFMDLMETFKIQHEAFTPSEAQKSVENYTTLIDLNDMLVKKFISLRKQLPGSDKELDRKIGILVDEIYKNVNYSKVNEFHQIILAGRTFKLERLRRAIDEKFKGRLTKDNPAKNHLIFHENTLKQVCLGGAFNTNFFRVNFNSELVGLPVQSVDKPDPQKKKSAPKIFEWLLWIFARLSGKKDSAPNGKDSGRILESFFYDGLTYEGRVYGERIRIGATDYRVHHREDNQEDFRLFYKGDGFIKLWPGRTAVLHPIPPVGVYSEMVVETLFPFAYVSFDQKPSNGEHPFKNRKKRTGATEESPLDKPEDKGPEINNPEEKQAEEKKTEEKKPEEKKLEEKKPEKNNPEEEKPKIPDAPEKKKPDPDSPDEYLK